MTFNEYQQEALRFAAVPDVIQEFAHRTLGLVGEAGEVAEKVKKIYRDNKGDFSNLDKKDIEKELGDVLWYIATLADMLDISLEDIAVGNISKLDDRLKRGKLGGSGDNR